MLYFFVRWIGADTWSAPILLSCRLYVVSRFIENPALAVIEQNPPNNHKVPSENWTTTKLPNSLITQPLRKVHELDSSSKTHPMHWATTSVAISLLPNLVGTGLASAIVPLSP
jgi:hypothetical protein